MGAKRRNLSLFSFIRKYRGVASRGGYISSGVRRQKLFELINFAQTGLKGEFRRLVYFFRTDRVVKWGRAFARRRKDWKLRKERYGVRSIGFSVNTWRLGFGVNSFLSRVGAIESRRRVGRRLRVSRFIVRILRLLVNEPRFCDILAIRFPGLVLSLLMVVSKTWRFLLRDSTYFDDWQRFKFSVRARRIRRRLLGRRALVGVVRSAELRRLQWLRRMTARGLFGRWRLNIGRWRRVRRGRLERLFEFRRKLQRFWGGLTLRQLWKYRVRANTRLHGLWESYAFGLFECRLDVFLVRIGFVEKLWETRAYIKNGLVLINGLAKTFYRYAVGEGDVVQLWPQRVKQFQLLWLRRLWQSLNEAEGSTRYRVFPNYLEFSFKRLAGCMVSSQFSLSNFVPLIRFDGSYVVNCGRFQF